MVRIKLSFFFVFICCCHLSLFAQRENLPSSSHRDTVHLNNQWQFLTDKQTEGFKRGWYVGSLPNARTISIPHTWNIEDSNQTHYGWAWYQKKINIPAIYKNKQTVI